MKAVVVTLLRPSYTTVLVNVPDDFNPQHLLHFKYNKALQWAERQQDSYWDDEDDQIEGHEVDDPEPAEGICPDHPIDITEQLKQCDGIDLEQHRRYLEAKAKKEQW